MSGQKKAVLLGAISAASAMGAAAAALQQQAATTDDRENIDGTRMLPDACVTLDDIGWEKRRELEEQDFMLHANRHERRAAQAKARRK